MQHAIVKISSTSTQVDEAIYHNSALSVKREGRKYSITAHNDQRVIMSATDFSEISIDGSTLATETLFFAAIKTICSA